MNHEELESIDNVSTVIQFVLIGFSDLPNLQGFLFAVFSVVYIIILIGNFLIIIIISMDQALQKPMYFFLANFSSLEICYVSVTVPRILFNIGTQNRSISLMSCATQMSFFLVFGTTESLLLAVMSYDRYVAICHPLLYPLIMNPTKCKQLAAVSWLGEIGRAHV